ncbi:hypothetical protein RCL1_002055 [Eukaryota sp. TZLM3-RCL]
MSTFTDFATQKLASNLPDLPPDIIQALSLVLSPSTTSQLRSEAQTFLDSIKQNPSYSYKFSLSLSLLSKSTDLNSQFFACSLLQSIIENDWNSVTSSDQNELIQFIIGLICLQVSSEVSVFFSKSCDLFGRLCRKILYNDHVTNQLLSPFFDLMSSSFYSACIVFKSVFEHCQTDGTRKEVRTTVSTVCLKFWTNFLEIFDLNIHASTVILQCLFAGLQYTPVQIFDQYFNFFTRLSVILSSTCCISIRLSALDIYNVFVTKKLDDNVSTKFNSLISEIVKQSLVVFNRGDLIDYDYHKKLVDLITSLITKYSHFISKDAQIFQQIIYFLSQWMNHPSQIILSSILLNFSEFSKFCLDQNVSKSLNLAQYGDVTFLTHFLRQCVLGISKVGFPSNLDEKSTVDNDQSINQKRQLISLDFESQDLYFAFLSRLRSAFRLAFKFFFLISKPLDLINVIFSLFCDSLNLTVSSVEKRSGISLTLHSASIIRLESCVTIFDCFFQHFEPSNLVQSNLIDSSELSIIFSQCQVLLNFLVSLEVKDCFLVLFLCPIFVTLLTLIIQNLKNNLENFNPCLEKCLSKLLSWTYFEQPNENRKIPSKNLSSARRKAATSLLELATKNTAQLFAYAGIISEAVQSNLIADDSRLYLYEILAEFSNILSENEGRSLIVSLFSPLSTSLVNICKESSLLTSPQGFLSYFGMDLPAIDTSAVSKRSKLYWLIAYLSVLIKRTLNSVDIFHQIYPSIIHLYSFLLSLQSPATQINHDLITTEEEINQSISDEVFEADNLVLVTGSAPTCSQISAFKFVIHHVKGFCCTIISQSTYKQFIFNTTFLTDYSTSILPCFNFISFHDLRTFLKPFTDALYVALPAVQSFSSIFGCIFVPTLELICRRLVFTFKQLKSVECVNTNRQGLQTELSLEKGLADISRDIMSLFGGLFVTNQAFEPTELSSLCFHCPEATKAIILNLSSLLPHVQSGPYSRFIAIFSKFFLHSLKDPILQETFGWNVLEFLLVSFHESPLKNDIPGETFSFIRDVYLSFSYIQDPTQFSSPPLSVSIPKITSSFVHFPRMLFQSKIGPIEPLETALRSASSFTDQRAVIKHFIYSRS